MIKRYFLQVMLVLLLVAAAGVCFNALLDYGRSHNALAQNDRVRAMTGTVRERPPMPGHNRPGNPHPGTNPFPAPSDHHPAKDKDSGGGYPTFLLIYAAVFFLLAGLVYYGQASGKINISTRNSGLILCFLMVLGLLLRLFLSTLIEGHSGDLAFFRNWSATAAQGLAGFYSNSRCDYPPLYIYVLWLVGKAARLAILQPYTTILLKLPSMLADLATAWLIWQWGRHRLSREAGVLLAAFYIFNPAVFINSTLWGQVDSFFTLLVALAVWTLSQSRIGVSSALFSAAVLMKPQGIIFLPVLAFEILRRKNLKTVLIALGWAVAAAVVIVLPFARQQGAGWIVSLFTGTIGEYPFASVNAFNLFYLLGANYAPDSQIAFLTSYHNWGMLFIVLTTAYAWWSYARGNTPRMVPAAALLLIAGVFTLGPSMHERYLFPALALAILAFIALADKRFLLLAGGFSVSVLINTGMILFAGMNPGISGSLAWAATLTCLLNIGLLLYLILCYSDRP